MTKEELLAVPRHSRVRYIGKDQTIITELQSRKKNKPLEQILTYVYDYEKNSWAKERGLSLSTYSGGSFENTVPEDWEVIDAKRMDLTRTREKRKVKYADRNVKSELDSFTSTLDRLQSIKSNIDYHLADLSVADKLKILTSLSDEQKLWFEALELPAAQLKEAVKKAVKDIVDADEPVEPVVVPQTPEVSNDPCPSV